MCVWCMWVCVCVWGGLRLIPYILKYMYSRSHYFIYLLDCEHCSILNIPGQMTGTERPSTDHLALLPVNTLYVRPYVIAVSMVSRSLCVEGGGGG